MIKDLKKFLDVMKASEYRNKLSMTPRYHDGFEILAKRLHPKTQKVIVSKITEISSNVKLFKLVSKDPDKPLAYFRAGQYIGVKANINGVFTTRAYSLVSSPNNVAYYEIAVKNLEENGFMSKYLYENIKIGDTLELTEPLGRFYYNPIFHGKNLVFIAGGCGVTPYISMIREVYEKDLNINIHLIYGCLTENDRLFHEELNAIAAEKANITVSWVLSEPSPEWNGLKGFVTKDILESLVKNWAEKMVYFVGPDLMKRLILENLDKIGIFQHRILCEAAPPPLNITDLPEWPKNIDPSKKIKCKVHWAYSEKEYIEEITVSCSEPLLNGMERAKLKGFKVNSACRSGECAFCRSHLLSGKVFVPLNIIIREADQKMGFIHPCVSYPLEDVEIEVFLS